MTVDSGPTETGWHSASTVDTLAQLQVRADTGLTPAQIVERRGTYGPNRLTEVSGPPLWLQFFRQFQQALVYVLIVAGVVTLALGELVDGAVILGVVLLNAVIGFVQEHQAVQAIDALSRSMQVLANVIRSGEKQQLPAAELVPGDLVLLVAGDQVPADLRLIATRDLRIAEAALTGESLPVEKSINALGRETVLAERKNMAFTSTLVTAGMGTGIVTATGDRTEIGRISTLIRNATDLETPLGRQLTRFSQRLLWIILGLGCVTFTVGTFRGEPAVDMFHAAVALAVGAIPEGLPAAVTITLAIGVARMARRNAIIRRLPAVETLGGTSVICTDKTGTLTENQMTVQKILAGDTVFDVEGIGYEPIGLVQANGRPVSAASLEQLPDAVDDQMDDRLLIECLVCGALCNDSRMLVVDDSVEIRGDPTEGALLVSAAKVGLRVSDLSTLAPRLDTLPFESEHRDMATLHRVSGQAQHVIFVKGALESLLPRCNDLDQADELRLRRLADEFGSAGLRVLAFAKKRCSADQSVLTRNDIMTGLEFLGLQAMIDPPRSAAKAAVDACRQAGIRVKMMTGDHAVTAAAIADQLGLDGARGPNGQLRVLTGHELSALRTEDLVTAAESVSVFARVAPEDKLNLVRALQSQGAVVAMTGDGVNDGPALKQADIGIAMGITGTEVAKDAADMVLTDDNFASIAAAIEEGRCVFDNLIKFITWTLPTNLGQGLVILVAIFLGTDLPIEPLQILWINMTTAVFLGLTLTFEPQELGLMDRPPRPPKQPILTLELGRRIILVAIVALLGAFGLFRYSLSQGYDLPAARCVAMNVFVMISVGYLFNCRSLTQQLWRFPQARNPFLWCGVTVMILAQLAVTYLPGLNQAFHLAPITLASWCWIGLVSLASLLIVELDKWLFSLGKPPVQTQ